MTLQYGFFKAKLTGNPTMRKKPMHAEHETQYHMHISLAAVGLAVWDCAINVGTNNVHDLLRYRMVSDFSHPICSILQSAPQGFNDLTSHNALPALDFLRSDVLTHGNGTGSWNDTDVMNDGVLKSTTEFQPVESLNAALDRAASENADVYAFGRSYKGGDFGIHDIHMNQGSTGDHFKNNGNDDNDHNDVWQDGAVLINYPDNSWVVYFTAFTQQMVPTDDSGNPEEEVHEINDSDPGSLIAVAESA